MRLLIVSDMAHFVGPEGVAGWGPTVQEIDHLASLFAEVRHIACIHRESAPVSALPYRASNVEVIGVPPSGGARLSSKLGILRLMPAYVRTIAAHLGWADVVHVRCPANICFAALALLAMNHHPARRWVKYAGNWHPAAGEPPSYRLQRWLLRRGVHRGLVTVNGEWPDQPGHVRAFVNPCLTAQELSDGRAAAAGKALALPIRLIFVGWLGERKGAMIALETLAALRATGIDAVLDIVGDGPQRSVLTAKMTALGVQNAVRMPGWVPRPSLGSFLTDRHFILLPSASEGWPKVLSEAMAYGVVPLAAAVSAIPQTLRRLHAGTAIGEREASAYVGAIRTYLEDPVRWTTESRAGIEAAPEFSYESYLRRVRDLLGMARPVSSVWIRSIDQQ